MALSNNIHGKALRFGFRYDVLGDQWVSDSGARLRADNMTDDQLLNLMAQSAQLSMQAGKSDWLDHLERAQKLGVTYSPEEIQKMKDMAMFPQAVVIPSDPVQVAYPDRPRPPFPGKRSNYEKLAVRLDVPAGETFGFEHVHIVETSKDVHVLIVHNDQCVLMRDGKELFPSDELIGKIRLLQ